MWGRASMLMAAFAAVAGSACSGGDTSRCADGTLCPRGFVCVSAPVQGCALPEQLEACAGEVDGTACTVLGNEAVCASGVCLAGDCGDGLATVGEACDDGNKISGDGCSAGCDSDETCGNAVLDEGEECDCGSEQILATGCTAVNSDAAGATCRSDCIAHCGDGVVNAAEDCDSAPVTGGCFGFGFDRGALPCSTGCSADFTACENFGVHPIGGPGLEGRQVTAMAFSPDGTLYMSGGNVLAVRLVSGWSVYEAPTTFLSGFDFNGLTVWGDGGAMAIGTFSSIDGVAPTARRWNGAAWQNMPAPTGLFVKANGIWASSETDVVAVGREYTGSAFIGKLWKFDGTSWTSLASPASEMQTVHGSGDVVLAVGGIHAVWRRNGVWQAPEIVPDVSNVSAAWVAPDGTALVGGDAGKLLYHDGVEWTPVESNTTASITAIFGRAVDDVYAITGGGLLHFDGDGWMPLATASNEFSTGAFLGTEAHVAGRHFVESVIFDDGWRLVGDSEFAAIGRCGVAQGSIHLLEDGSYLVWRDGGFTSAPQLVLDARDMAVVEANEAILLTGTNVHVRPGNVPPPYTLNNVGVAVAAVSISDIVVAAARVCPQPADCSPSVRRFDGTWTTHTIAVAETDTLVDIEYINGNPVVLSREGELWQWNGSAFTNVDTIPATGLRTLWGTSDEIFAGGDDGQLWHFDGATWQLTVLSDRRIISIDGSATDDVIATTVDAALYFDGQSWSPFRVPSLGIFDVCVTEGDIFAAMTNGQLGRLRRTAPW